jgi:integrase/recombinase XerD
MSINLKVRLFKGKTLADGSHPIQLQFYLRGKLKRKNIYACFADNWDEKKIPGQKQSQKLLFY